MKLYAETPGRRLSQVLGDLLLLLWIPLWAWVGVGVHDGTMRLAEPGRDAAASATSLSEGLSDAGGQLEELPFVGSQVSAPFESAASASTRLAAAGEQTVEAVERLALWLGLSIALIPVLCVLVFYLPLRWRFVRRATAGARFIDSADDLDLFALRALANQPMHVLARVSDDPAGAWRRRDADVVRRLAELELRDAGLRPPPVSRAGAGG